MEALETKKKSQVLVWIQNATAGPTGDYFRPLGVPNTSYRVLDGATAALVVADGFHYASVTVHAHPLP